MKGLYALILSAICFSGSLYAAPMDLATFKRLGNESVNSKRCVGGIAIKECHEELEYAKSKNLIDASAYNWGKTNGFYPAIDRRNVIKAICKCGCFEANTLISTLEQGNIPVRNLTTKHSVQTLSEKATLKALLFSEQSIKLTTQGEESVALYVIKLSNGSTLKLTQHHGVLLADGTMTSAKKVTLKDSMLTANGQAVKVVSINREYTDEDVFNFETQGFSKNHHIVIAEDILVGDVVWQNQYAQELDAILLRQ
jgi:hypothetical protein